MKTSKLVMIATVLIIAIVGVSSLAELKANAPSHGIDIKLRAAIENPGLLEAMVAQLNPNFLLEKAERYTQVVSYEGDLYYITGTYKQWVRFFKLKNISVQTIDYSDRN